VWRGRRGRRSGGAWERVVEVAEDDGGLADGPAGVEEVTHLLVDRVGREQEVALGGEVLEHVAVAQALDVERDADADAHHVRAHLPARGEESQFVAAAADAFSFSSGHRRSFVPVPAPGIQCGVV
jgi:hypothetical protein